ncbi:MAG: CPBP family intramembrane metalloprotease [Cytophagaceae bacterium]|jgi:hypothetical protein|nr:CPBP family intramembrane metalloprotease [Cytophagaceae bacterium]
MRYLALVGIFLRLFGFIYLASIVSFLILNQWSTFPSDSSKFIEYLTGHPEVAPVLGFADMAGKIVGFIILPILYFQYIQRRINIEPLFRFPESVHLLLGIGILFTSFIWVSAIADWNKTLPFSEWFPTLSPEMDRLEKLSASVIQLFLTWDSVEIVVISILFIAVIPAVGEEIIFRGALQTELLHWFKKPHVAIWVTAATFSFIHFQFYGFIPRMLLGALFGYVAYWSGSIWTSIVLHFLNNFITLVWLVLFHQKQTSLDPENTGYIPWYVSLCCAGITAYFLYRLYERQVQPTLDQTTRPPHESI